MSKVVRYTIAQLEKMDAAGLSKTRPDAPRGPPLGPDFWKKARVVWPEDWLAQSNDVSRNRTEKQK